MGLGKPQRQAKLKVAVPSLCKNIKGYPKFWGASLAQGHIHFFQMRFDDELWQTPAACQIWSRWLLLLRKYKGIVFKRQIRFWAILYGVKGSVRTSPIARWKACGRLPIRDSCTFLLALTVETLVKVGAFQRGWVTLSANFRWKGTSPPTIVGIRKLEYVCYLTAKIAWSYLHLSG